MPTTAERHALLFIAGIGALGIGVRAVRARTHQALPPTAAAVAALDRQIAAVDSARAQRDSARVAREARQSGGSRKSASQSAGRKRGAAIAASSRPDEPAAPINLDVASAESIESLPGIGPALAGRIVADRAALGPFGSLEGLQRVKGIGPSLAGKLAGKVTFSAGPFRPPPAGAFREPRRSEWQPSRRP
ncbi:MAG: hypothetical protein FJ202_02935 [Gemmatimonadetes bacterium]|nr:hypothetical protein [Gemmatimonadota bacterium]